MTLKLVVESLEDVTDRIRVFSLVAAEGRLPAYQPGAHLTFDLGEVGERSYSLIDFVQAADPPERYRIAVQAEPDGDGGSLRMHRLAKGDVLSAMDPKNDFSLTEDGPYLLLAGGIGVTPIISFATALKAQGIAFDFHYACRSKDVCGFANQLTNVFGDTVQTWFDDEAPIDLAVVVGAASPDTQIYCCGPKGMIEAVREIADGNGHPHGNIHFELFATPASHEGDQPFEVEIASTGEVFVVPADRTIVEVLEDAGVDVMYDCQRGDCGICQTDVIAGEPDHRDVVLSDSERASGKIMQICVSRAKSARLVLDL